MYQHIPPHTIIRSLFTGLIGLFFFVVAPIATATSANSFDHSAWNQLLKNHVHVINQGQTSQVDYAAFLKNRQALRRYLSQLSAVSYEQFATWNKPDQLAFLINAYNAYTVELILTRYPNLKSIKALGSLLRSPWKKKFIPLLGKTVSLDHIEHDLIRQPGAYNEPRIHFAVNCASIGCPALHHEAFTGDKLEQQLDFVTKAFLSDRSRNRYNAKTGRLEVSKIFDWYSKDFKQGWGGWHSLAEFFTHYADSLSDSPQAKQAISVGNFKINYLDYDWALNDKK